MIDKVYNTIQKYNLIQPEDKIIIGLSGGADSMCLTHILWSLKDRLGICLRTAHMNHNIRGGEADKDAIAAEKFSESLDIPFSLKSEDVPEYAKKYGISEELAGRELRYAFFDEMLREYGFNKIATAHNRNDNAETILMNFMRGSGLRGLCGIPYKRGNIIRPVLDITREEIERYCRENNISYVTDSTNKEKIYTRNKIRLDLIPEIQRTFNSNFINTVTENAKIINEDSIFLDNMAEKFYSENVKQDKIIIHQLLSQPVSIRNRVILKMIGAASGSTKDLSSEFIDDIVRLAEKGISGAYINLPKGVCASVEYGSLRINKPQTVTDFEYIIPLNKEVYIKEINKTVYMERAHCKSEDGIYLSAGENDTVIIRNRRNGDVFYPKGMNGRKKLKDFFIDSKIPRDERDKTGIITINGEIAYIIGKRYDRRFDFRENGIKITLR